MKKRNLVKMLKEKGARLIREGANHEYWESAKGYRFPVGRHSDIPEPTAKAILKQAAK
ncbi:MAG: type II toxin-antitoxin system HicA family toxin [Proteobacteria bacterium]|nr:type II toxin-antitoxin system HicA family toxin [Pseudomonadota bacterium]